MNVYSVSVDTIIQCFCMDEEMHGDARHAPRLLKEFVNNNFPQSQGLFIYDKA